MSERDRHPEHDALPASAAPRKGGLVRKSVDALNEAVAGLKKQDMTALVETFTAEMTLVAEGLSEDQAQLSQRVAELSAIQTIADEKQQAQAESTANALQDLRKRVEGLEKANAKTAKQRGTINQALRQLTWIAAIIGAAWVITALLKTFGG